MIIFLNMKKTNKRPKI